MSADPVTQPGDEALVTSALLAAGDYLGLGLAELARTVGVSEASMKGYSRGSRELKQPKSLELALGLIRAYRALYAILGGDRAQMRHWMSTPNRHFRDRAPRELIQTYQGLAEINVYLDAMRGRV